MSRPVQTAEILAVGSEMLTPSRTDTNSLFLTAQLEELGIRLRQKHVIGDDADELRAAVADAIRRVDLVITTGGLGPTDDDLTRDAVAAVLGRPLEPVAEILASIAGRFASRGVPMPDVNRRQAEVIAGARWLPNANGTAPGQMIEVDEALVVLLPGPPREMRPMFTTHVGPVLASRSGGRRVRRRVIRTTGRSESQIEEVVQPVYADFVRRRPALTTTILASPGLIEIQLVGADADVDGLDRALDAAAHELTAVLGDVVFAQDACAIEEVVGAELGRRGLSIALAESCTGGLLLQRLTDIPGSSAWVRGGVVAYANDIKVRELAVDPSAIETYGAVSEAVARAMAAGVRSRMNADIGVGITGVAGPGGGTDEKPVGTVWIAVATHDVAARRFLFPGDRQMVRQFAATAALEMVRRTLPAMSLGPEP